jgi:hypothetical protein
MPVVPEPPKGSKTVPPSGQPANTHGSIKSFGKVAKCAPLNGLVVIVHTDLLFFLARAHTFWTPLVSIPNSPLPLLICFEVSVTF